MHISKNKKLCYSELGVIQIPNLVLVPFERKFIIFSSLALFHVTKTGGVESYNYCNCQSLCFEP